MFYGFQAALGMANNIAQSSLKTFETATETS